MKIETHHMPQHLDMYCEMWCIFFLLPALDTFLLWLKHTYLKWLTLATPFAIDWASAWFVCVTSGSMAVLCHIFTSFYAVCGIVLLLMLLYSVKLVYVLITPVCWSKVNIAIYVATVCYKLLYLLCKCRFLIQFNINIIYLPCFSIQELLKHGYKQSYHLFSQTFCFLFLYLILLSGLFNPYLLWPRTTLVQWCFHLSCNFILVGGQSNSYHYSMYWWCMSMWSIGCYWHGV